MRSFQEKKNQEYSEMDAEKVVFLIEFFVNFMNDPEKSHNHELKNSISKYLLTLKSRIIDYGHQYIMDYKEQLITNTNYKFRLTALFQETLINPS